jgi:ribosomal-protein-alanine N-acetyltransferase
VPADALQTGPTVHIRLMRESDRDAFVALRVASRSHLERWEPVPPSGLDLYSAELFDREMASVDTDASQRWMVVRNADGVPLGRIAMTAIERGPFQNGRLGYWIGAAHAGQGYMSEGVGLAVRHAFAAMGLHRVCANIMPANAASRRVLERNGFVREGFSEKYLQIAGRWEDHERWAITRERWPGLTAAR